MHVFKKYPEILCFAVLQVFFTAPGQTFLISLFVVPMFSELGVSMTKFAGIFSLATVLGAVLLNAKGFFLDKSPIRNVLITGTLLMSLACVIIAKATTLSVLFMGFLLLRCLGQGGFTILASTVLARNFEKNRGKATGVMMLGYPLSEWIYPFLSVLLMASIGWRGTYLFFAITFIVVMLPLQLWLLHRAKLRPGKFLPGESLQASDEDQMTQIPLKQAIRMPVFHLTIWAYCLPPVLMTGLFFYQSFLFEQHGWPLEYAAIALSVYAAFKAVFGLLAGPIVDRRGPVEAFSIMIVLLGVATILGGIGGPVWMIFIYYSILGTAIGISGTLMNALWPSLFGTHHLGTIKSFVGTFRNGLTALGPLPLAVAIDHHWSLTWILVSTGLGSIAMGIIPFIIAKMAPQLRRNPKAA